MASADAATHAAIHPDRKLWTREEAVRLSELFPDERYELLEGELITKMGQNPPHAYLIMLLAKALLQATDAERIRVQMSIELPAPEGDRSEPEPDLVVLHEASSKFYGRHPAPTDIALLIEVALTTFPSDRTTKYRLYARTGINEYWIVDLLNRRTVVCRRPAGDEYASVTIYQAGEEFAPLFNPDLRICLDRLLPAKLDHNS